MFVHRPSYNQDIILVCIRIGGITDNFILNTFLAYLTSWLDVKRENIVVVSTKRCTKCCEFSTLLILEVFAKMQSANQVV